MSGYYPPSTGGGGGGSGLPIADPTGVTSETAPNTVKGSGTYDVATFPADTTFLAVKLEGDDFPRLAMNVNPSGWGAIFFGDGTGDPIDGAAGTTSLYFDGTTLYIDAELAIGPVTTGGVTTPGNLTVSDHTSGVVLTADEGSQHRLVVAADGTLSTVPFP